MTSNTTQDPFWEIQVSLAKGVARLPRPSLAKLHYEVLEEMGKPPGLDLVDYFVSLVGIPEEEVREYFRFIGKDVAEKTQRRKTGDNTRQLAEQIAGQPGASVLKFRQAFMERFGRHPSEKETGFFLQAVREGTDMSAGNTVNPEDGHALARRIAGQPGATVLRFRQAHQKEYGSAPSPELTQYFLEMMRHGNQDLEVLMGEDDGEGLASQMEFAKTIAGDSATTILQFRQAFEKAYGSSPPAEVTEVFLHYLSLQKENRE